jgi:hypothetical protein
LAASYTGRPTCSGAIRARREARNSPISALLGMTSTVRPASLLRGVL